MESEQREALEAAGGTAFVITVSRMALVVFALLGVTVAQLAIKRCARARKRRRAQRSGGGAGGGGAGGGAAGGGAGGGAGGDAGASRSGGSEERGGGGASDVGARVCERVSERVISEQQQRSGNASDDDQHGAQHGEHGDGGERVASLNDTLEFVETVVFSIQVTISVRACVQLIAAWGEGGWVGRLGGWVAVVAVVLQVVFVAKYGLSVRTLRCCSLPLGASSAPCRCVCPPPLPNVQWQVRTLQQKLAADAGLRGHLRASPSFLPGKSMLSKKSMRPSQKRRAKLVAQPSATQGPGPSPGPGGILPGASGRGSHGEDGIDAGLAAPSSARHRPTTQPPRAGMGRVGRSLKELGERWDRLADALDARFGWSPGCRKLPPTRLRNRLSFITDRFTDDKPYWQFVLWARQTCLILAVSLPDMQGAALDEVPGDAHVHVLCPPPILCPIRPPRGVPPLPPPAGARRRHPLRRRRRHDPRPPRLHRRAAPPPPVPVPLPERARGVALVVVDRRRRPRPRVRLCLREVGRGRGVAALRARRLARSGRGVPRL